MKRGSVIACVAAILSLLSCTKERVSGNGPIITESRNPGHFSVVELSGSSRAHISQGAAFSVSVRGFGNLLPYFETKLVNGTLLLAYRNNVNVSNDNIEVFITMPSLNGLRLAGSGEIDANGNFPLVPRFDTRIAGSGNIRIGAGASQQFFSVIEGSGNLYAAGFITEKADIFTNGSGNTEITVNSELKVRITGSGNVYYHGVPAITSHITGSGAVIPL